MIVADSIASEAWDWIDECFEGWNGESSSENFHKQITFFFCHNEHKDFTNFFHKYIPFGVGFAMICVVPACS